MNFFDLENVDILLDLHNEPEQLERQKKILEVAVKIKNKTEMLDKELQTMTTTKGYEVTLENCTCRDFEVHRKPCKHIYKLANKLGIFIKSNERSDKLIADFSKGYADGWKFIVRTCNYPDLDIDYTTKNLILTQGKRYNFKIGEIFFDNIAAYKEIWQDALKKINFCVQIDSVTESLSVPEVIFDDGKFINQITEIYGVVDFSLYKTNDYCTALEKIKNFSCGQDEFVELLKIGEFADTDGEIHKILEV